MSKPKKYVNKVGMVLAKEVKLEAKIKQSISIQPYFQH